MSVTILSQLSLQQISWQFFTFYCSYDHPHILSGQGTIGVEILEQVPDVDAIIVPVGGGGLLAGLCVAVKSIRPEVMIVVSRFQRNIYSWSFLNVLEIFSFF